MKIDEQELKLKVEAQIAACMAHIKSQLTAENYRGALIKAIDSALATSMLFMLSTDKEVEEIKEMQGMHLVILAAVLNTVKKTSCSDFLDSMVDNVVEHYRNGELKVVIGGRHGPDCTCFEEVEGVDAPRH